MVETVIKKSFQKLKPRATNHRDYKSFENKLFWEESLYELLNATLKENAIGFEEFTKVCLGLRFNIYKQNPFKSNNA